VSELSEGFEVKSGKLIVTDPCYDVGTWCQGVIEHVKKGAWSVEVDYEKREQRCGVLEVRHIDARESDDGWEKMSFEVGVDSGQAGIFDFSAYPKGDRGESGHYNKDKFYDECCETTLKDAGYGVIRGRGAVSSSGYGDGGYSCYVRRHPKTDEVIAVKVVFIGEFSCEGCGIDVESEDDLSMGKCEDCARQEERCEKCGDFFPLDELNGDLVCTDCATGQNVREDE
jgi:hypothetical protein